MDKRVIRGIYLYEFKLGTTAKEADEKINAAFGQGCSTIRTAYRWYQKFRNGDESLEEHEGRGRHSDVDEDKLRMEMRAWKNMKVVGGIVMLMRTS
ncbi:unnamed protein product [Heligmosomoides polygyrus]|uniref:HTH_48 domain-containing protein n=1 Tax=Heligmosomoides polygyrus TaxID=6339 RepID=A0A183GAY6_HELPZ|nr:unnamed protein product [Heligmosomoides polygyrus]